MVSLREHSPCASNFFPTAMLALMAVLGAGLLVKGFGQFLLIEGTGYDLKLSWINQHYFLRGVNPFDVTMHISGPGWLGKRRTVVWSDLGVAETTTYPPWAYVNGILFHWPGWPQVRAYYLAWNLLACAFLAWWIARTAEAGRSRKYRWWLAGASFTNIAISQTLINGNYGVLVTALIAGCFLLDELGYEAAAGFLMGIAMTKPTIAAPFFLLLLVRKRWTAAGVSAAWVLLAWGAASVYVHTPPLEFLWQMVRGPDRFSNFGGYALWQALAHFGMAKPAALLVNAVVVAVPGIWLMYRLQSDLLPALAVAAVTARLFTYHNTIDNVALLFLPLALWLTPHLLQPASRIAFWIVSATLMLPARLTDLWIAYLALYAVWIAATLALVQRTHARLGAARLRSDPLFDDLNRQGRR